MDASQKYVDEESVDNCHVNEVTGEWLVVMQSVANGSLVSSCQAISVNAANNHTQLCRRHSD